MIDTISLVDDIYECAFVPEAWPAVLDGIAKIGEARGGVLATGTRRALSCWTSSAVFHDTAAHLFATDIPIRSERARRVIDLAHAGFVRENDIYEEEEVARDSLYHELLWPNGMGHAATTVAEMPTGDVFFLSVERAKRRGPVPVDAVKRLDVLRPHILRSAFLSARQQMTRASHTSDALALIGLPALVMNEEGRILAANELMDGLRTFITWRAFDRCAFIDREANGFLHAAIATIQTVDQKQVRSFVVRCADAVAAKVAHVLPLRHSARDIFSRCAAVLVLTPVSAPHSPPVELIQSLFDLTPAESRVARSIAAGRTIGEMARNTGVSENTIRTQLRGVLLKTGCRRQAEVASLLSGLRTLGE